jgi:hypothetical protein
MPPAALPDDFILLRRFRDMPEVLLASSILNSAGVEYYLGDENLIRMDWFYSNLIGGIKLWVRAADAETAAAMLEQNVPESIDFASDGEGAGNYQQPHCPVCGSFDISFEELDKPVAFLGLLAGLPIPLKHRGWNCHACSHTWQDPVPPSASNPHL